MWSGNNDGEVIVFNNYLSSATASFLPHAIHKSKCIVASTILTIYAEVFNRVKMSW